MRLERLKRARSAIVVALVGLVAVAVLGVAGIGSAGNLNNLDVSLEADPGPAEVTYGGNVAFTLDITNVSNNPWNKVLATVAAPETGPNSRAILKYRFCSGGTILPGTGTVNTSQGIVCDLGTLAPNATPKLFFVYEMPNDGSDCPSAQPACIKVDVSVTGKEGTSAPDSPKSKGREDVFPDSVSIILLDTFETDKREAATYALTACADASTPTLVTNEDLGPNNPIQTQVCIPSTPVGDQFNPGHTIVVNERDHGPDDVGRTPQVSDICIPALGSQCVLNHTPFVFDELATFTFVLRNKSFSGQIDEVFEDGEPVSFDTNDDPHVVSITTNPSAGTTTVVVKGSDNGGWDFG